MQNASQAMENIFRTCAQHMHHRSHVLYVFDCCFDQFAVILRSSAPLLLIFDLPCSTNPMASLCYARGGGWWVGRLVGRLSASADFDGF